MSSCACAGVMHGRGFVKDVFDRIYARKSWGAYGKGSGLGSTITSTVVTRCVDDGMGVATVLT